jgi:hypothetical protein
LPQLLELGMLGGCRCRHLAVGHLETLERFNVPCYYWSFTLIRQSLQRDPTSRQLRTALRLPSRCYTALSRRKGGEILPSQQRAKRSNQDPHGAQPTSLQPLQRSQPAARPGCHQ